MRQQSSSLMLYGFIGLFILFIAGLLFRPLLYIFIAILIGLLIIAFLLIASQGQKSNGMRPKGSFAFGGGGGFRSSPSSSGSPNRSTPNNNDRGSDDSRGSNSVNPNQNILLIIGAVIAFFLIAFSG